MDAQQFNQILEQHIRLETHAVAVRLVKPGEDLPQKVRRPKRDLQIQATLCQGIAFSRRYGWTVAVGEEDLSCPLAATVFGFKPELDYWAKGHACYQMYTETLEAGAKSELEVERVPYQSYRYVLSAPLSRCDFEADVVIIYGNAAQVQRLVVAAIWKSGERIQSSFSGRLDCSDEILVPLKSGKPEVILPCYGDRVFAQTQNHEMAFTLPWDWTDRIAEGLEGTHKGGVRYPVPGFMRFTAEFPAHYQKMDELWEEGSTEK